MIKNKIEIIWCSYIEKRSNLLPVCEFCGLPAVKNQDGTLKDLICSLPPE